MKRNTMNQRRADALSRLLVRKKVWAYAGPHSFAVHLNGSRLFSESAYRKIRLAFLRRVIAAKTQYPAIQRIYAEEQLAQMMGIRS